MAEPHEASPRRGLTNSVDHKVTVCYILRMAIRVILESPYSGDVVTHTKYAHRCIRDSLKRGEAPFASHVLYTSSLDDKDPSQRTSGMEAGFEWIESASKTVVYVDYGISSGMSQGMNIAFTQGKEICLRQIGKNDGDE